MEPVAMQALELLRQLAVKIGTTTENLYPYFVRQMYLDAVFSLTSGVAFGLLVWAGAFVLFKKLRSFREGSDARIGCIVGIVVCLLVGSGFIFISLSTYGPQLLNPQYAAIRAIVQTALGK